MKELNKKLAELGISKVRLAKYLGVSRQMLYNYLAIDNILISGITRIIRANGEQKNKKEVISKFLTYLDENFPNYRSNPYLNYLSRNRKIIYKLILLKQYWLVSLIFKIKNIFLTYKLIGEGYVF